MAAEVVALRAEAEPTLVELENVIASGLKTFIDVGKALTKIRDGELYRAEHKTFEAYCSARWDFKKRHAYRLIDAAAVVENVSNWAHGTAPAITAESHARELAKLPPKQQPKAWAKAVQTAPSGVVTAKHVAIVVAAQLPKRTQKKISRVVSRDRAAAAQVLTYLEKLVAQRNAKPEFDVVRALQQAFHANAPAHISRVLNFILDGGELALLRLGLDWSVTEETLNAAYRAMSKRAHPDQGGSQEEFVALTRAKQLVLTMLGVAP